MSRKAHEPTDASRKQVEAMAAYGVPQESIASVLGVDPKTLRKHYRDELTNGSTKANSKVAESLYKNAISGNVSAQIFWCKTRLGWSETQKLEHAGPNGGPITTRNASDVTDDELAAIAAASRD